MKYAIYQGEIGLYAKRYIDTIEEASKYTYVKVEYLPITMNVNGGYCPFNIKYDKDNGFIEIIDVEEDTSPLTLEQMFPKNSDKFEYGWISPDGDTYNTGIRGHGESADYICEKFNLNEYGNTERTLEDNGWIKITRNDFTREKMIFILTRHITKRQADTLFDLGLYDDHRVQMAIEQSSMDW